MMQGNGHRLISKCHFECYNKYLRAVGITPANDFHVYMHVTTRYGT
jgi:hypothetical protein